MIKRSRYKAGILESCRWCECSIPCCIEWAYEGDPEMIVGVDRILRLLQREHTCWCMVKWVLH